MRSIITLLIFCFLTKWGLAQQPICSSQSLTKYVQYQLVETGYKNLEVNGIRHFNTGYWVSGFIEKIATANRDFILAKLNDTGGVEFVKVIGNIAQEGGYCSALPISDGCLISGRSKGTKDVAIISKITSTGNMVWSKTTESVTGSYDAFRGVHMDESKGQIVGVGTGMQQTGKANVMIVSLDKDGNTQWTKNIDLGGDQHHLNAIRKVDSIYLIAGWSMFSGVWKPTLIQITESGRIIKGQYSDVSGNSIYVDMEVSPSGKVYLLGFTNASGGQYALLTCMSKTGNVLWRKKVGFGNSDFGDNLFYENGSLWVFGQTTVPSAGKREFFVQYDTTGNVLNRGGLYESPFAFAAKINGWPVGRSHFGGIAVVGIDSKPSGANHFEIMYTNPCDKSACSVNPASSLESVDYSVAEKAISVPFNPASNGTLLDVSLSIENLNLKENNACYRSCTFDSRKVLPATLTICTGGSDILTTDVRNADYKYLWSNGDTAARHAFFKPGMYWVKTYNECGSRIDTVVVTGIDAPVYNKLVDTMYCERPWLRAISLPALAATTITWENGDVQWDRSVSAPGKYWFEIKNRCGVWRDTFVITEDSAPKSMLPRDLNLCNGKYVLLDGTQLGKGSYQYLWEDGYKGSSLWVTKNSTKILKTWNLCGSITDTVNIVFGECNCHFYIPNAFTPRASRGNNDVWQPVFNCGANAYFSIYSRWGECLVREQPIDVPWDGYYLGDLVPEGIYVYIIHGNYTDPDKGGQRIEKSGTLLVIDGGK